MRTVQAGATIVEYLLIALLCMSVVISAFLLTGKGFNISLSGLAADMKGNVSAAHQPPLIEDEPIVVPDPSDPDYNQYFLIKDVSTGKTTLVKFNPEDGKVILVSGSRGVEIVLIQKVLAGQFDKMTPGEAEMLKNICTLASPEELLPDQPQAWQCYGETVEIKAPNPDY